MSSRSACSRERLDNRELGIANEVANRFVHTKASFLLVYNCDTKCTVEIRGDQSVSPRLAIDMSPADRNTISGRTTRYDSLGY